MIYFLFSLLVPWLYFRALNQNTENTTSTTIIIIIIIIIILIIILHPFLHEHGLDRVFLMAFFQASRFFVRPGCNFNFLKLSLISWTYVLHGLPSLGVNLNEPSIAMWVFYVNSTCPNHLSLVWRKSSTVLATPNLLLNSTDDFPSLRQTLHIYRTICMSVQEIQLISLYSEVRLHCHIS